MSNIIQGFCLVAIIGTAYLLFRFFPRKIKVIDIVLVALFTVLKMVLQILSLNIPLFGFPSLRIGISQLPLMVGGMVLGPALGFVLGLVVDVVGLLISPTEFPFLGFTLGNILMAVLPALVKEFAKQRSDEQRKPIKLLYGLLIMIWLINFVALWLTKDIRFTADVTVELDLYKRLILLGIVSFFLLIIVIVYKLIIKKLKVTDRPYEVWFSGVIIAKLVVNVILTSYWLEVMYGIPFFASSAIRILNMTILVNVEGFLGYLLLVLLDRIIGKRTDSSLAP